jgi:hypothetical protein
MDLKFLIDLDPAFKLQLNLNQLSFCEIELKLFLLIGTEMESCSLIQE